MRKLSPILLIIFVLSFYSCKQEVQPEPQKVEKDTSKMEWFDNAKLGIFIHWGIYSTGKTSESWDFHNKNILHEDYMKQLNEFTASKYAPAYWIELIKNTGAHYTVITSKHHDGVALWGTKMNNLSTAKSTPAMRDVLTPFVNEVRKNNIKLGLYYSLIDWTHADYPGFLKDSSKYEIAKEPERWQHFLNFNEGQIKELLAQYNPDLMWFDGDWEHSAVEWKSAEIRDMIYKNNPKTIINGRLNGLGDYETPEQNVPISRPSLQTWELCMTINDSWGYYLKDTNNKTPYEIISIFADCISLGGNLLLDIGPREDGTIPDEQVHVLKELGKWNQKHAEAIFDSKPGMPLGHFFGPTTISADSTNLYLFLQGQQSGNVVIKGLMNKIESVEVLGNGTKLTPKIVGKISWSPVPGQVFIDIPENVQDEYITVLKLKLDSPIKLYRGKGGLSL